MRFRGRVLRNVNKNWLSKLVDYESHLYTLGGM